MTTEARIGHMIRCDQCDNGIIAGWLFCPYCGYPQSDEGIEGAQRELTARQQTQAEMREYECLGCGDLFARRKDRDLHVNYWCAAAMERIELQKQEHAQERREARNDELRHEFVESGFTDSQSNALVIATTDNINKELLVDMCETFDRARRKYGIFTKNEVARMLFWSIYALDCLREGEDFTGFEQEEIKLLMEMAEEKLRRD